MDTSEQEFFKKLKETFREEALEHLKLIAEGLLTLEKELPQESRNQLIETIFREAHSLKGAARAVNQKDILEICQKLESIFSLWKTDEFEIPRKVFDILHASLNTISEALKEAADSNLISKTLADLERIIENPHENPVILKNLPTKPENSISLKSNQEVQEKTIRISLEKVNSLFQEVEETLMIKLFIKQQSYSLQEIEEELYLQEKNLGRLYSKIQIQRQTFQKSDEEGREWIVDTLKLLEQQTQTLQSIRKKVNKILKSGEQNAHFIGSTIDSLLEHVKKVLMQPISTLFDSFPQMIRNISRELSKEINLRIQGGEIEVDRRVLEEIKDPIIHLIRNAIDHGIESPEERVKNNKEPVGEIRISISEEEGNKVRLSISDDGKGLDLAKLKQAALNKGVISEYELSTMSEEDAINLAFHSGISTSQIITDLSGRGLGLGIVSEKVEKLGGQIKVSTLPNNGTTFTLNLPLTLATFRGIHLSVKGHDFILPTHSVTRVVRIPLEDIKKAENKETIVVDNHSYSFVYLSELLGIHDSNRSNNKNAYIYALIVRDAKQTMAFGVDYVYSEQEILVKGFGKKILRLKNIMAATVMETGQVIPILNPADLIQSSIKGISSPSLPQGTTPSNIKKTILLAEDSLTTRMLFTNILVNSGFDVKTAVDGKEALDLIQNQKFDMLVTDVDMPRMNGFLLTEKVRGLAEYKDLPIIICTALGSREDREKGIELGANAYLDKNTFNQQLFINIVQQLI